MLNVEIQVGYLLVMALIGVPQDGEFLIGILFVIAMLCAKLAPVSSVPEACSLGYTQLSFYFL